MTIPFDINVIAIGPDCSMAPVYYNDRNQLIGGRINYMDDFSAFTRVYFKAVGFTMGYRYGCLQRPANNHRPNRYRSDHQKLVMNIVHHTHQTIGFSVNSQLPVGTGTILKYPGHMIYYMPTTQFIHHIINKIE